MIFVFILLISLLTSCDNEFFETECLGNNMYGYNSRSASYTVDTTKSYDVFYPEFDGKKTYLTVTVDNLKNQNVYFIFSNVSRSSADSNPTVSGYSASEIREQISRSLTANTTYDAPISRSGSTDDLRDTVGDVKTFYVQNVSTSAIESRSFTCKSANVIGDKQLSIFVENNGRLSITDEMYESLSDIFMIDSDDNDIYDWVTGLYGEEWGEHSSSNMIAPNNNITILLYYDSAVNSQSTSSYTLGYFWNKDNYKKDSGVSTEVKYSNERIMFYINGSYYSKTSGKSWSPTNSYATKIYSTLAHEFQHMIHFYQKVVKYGLKQLPSTWLNEMCSLVTEDLVADKLGVYGPRGRTSAECQSYRALWSSSDDYNNGRLPYFNEKNDIYSIFSWSSANSAYCYSPAYAFGAYILRNYGGPDLMRRIVQNASASDDIIMEETGVSFETLMRKWGAACMLSTIENVEEGLLYNKGSLWQTWTFGGIDYNVGSINLWNYAATPKLFTATSSTEKSIGSGYSLGSATNRYCVAAQSKTGTLKKYVKLEENTALTIVVR